jgi:hypothetical protein
MGDAPAFVIKGDAHALVMGDTPAFVIKGDARALVMGDGMGDAPTFVIKGDPPLETHISFTCIIVEA